MFPFNVLQTTSLRHFRWSASARSGSNFLFHLGDGTATRYPVEILTAANKNNPHPPDIKIFRVFPYQEQYILNKLVRNDRNRAENTGEACLLTSGLWYAEQVYEKNRTLFPRTVLEAPFSHRPSGGYRVGRGHVVLVPEPPGCRFLPHDPRHPGRFAGHHQRHRHRGAGRSGGCGGPGGRQDRGLRQRQGRQDRGLRLRRGGRHGPGPDR